MNSFSWPLKSCLFVFYRVPVSLFLNMYFYLFFLYWRRCSGALTGIFVFDDAHGSTRCLCSGHSISETNTGKPAPSVSGMRGGVLLSAAGENGQLNLVPPFPGVTATRVFGSYEEWEWGARATRDERRGKNSFWTKPCVAAELTRPNGSNDVLKQQRDIFQTSVVGCHRLSSLRQFGGVLLTVCFCNVLIPARCFEFFFFLVWKSPLNIILETCARTTTNFVWGNYVDTAIHSRLWIKYMCTYCMYIYI